MMQKEAAMDFVGKQKDSIPTETHLQKIEDEVNRGGHTVDIDKWVASLERILEDVPQYMCRPGHPGRITRIPENLREVDGKSYEPYFLSIGPYHHGKSSLRPMEKIKHCVLKWVLEQKPELSLKDYLKEIKDIEPLARSFYTDIAMESEEFVRMLLLDSLYIVTVFCGVTKIERVNSTNINSENSVDNEDTNERINQINEGNEMGVDKDNMQIITRFGEKRSSEINVDEADEPRWFWILLEHDIFLLENQLPFFVLHKIHSLAYGDSERQLFVKIKHEFSKFLTHYTTLDSDLVFSPTEEVHHLLQLCHMFLCPTHQNESTVCQINDSSQMFRLGSAVQLYEEGVRFEARYGSILHSFLDIKFDNNGKLYMPCLYVEDNTVSLLRNLIALEQMKYPSMGLDVSAYVVLLLHLITIPEDVKLLRRKGIIQHHLASDKEMVYLVNRLSVGLSFDYVEDKYSLKPVFQELKRYSDRRVPRWNAWLKHRYFDNPWTTISLLAASLLLLLTVVQTFYAVFSYYHPLFDGHT